MAKVKTNKRINQGQLQEHLGVETLTVAGNNDSDEEKEIDAPGMSQTELQDKLSTYIYDADHGRPISDQRLIQVRQKAQAVIEGTDTFTAAQVQQLLARLILRELGEDN